MSESIFYNGEIIVTPPMTKSDAAIFADAVNLVRNEGTLPIFAVLDVSPDPAIFCEGLLDGSEDGSLITAQEGESYEGVDSWLALLLEHFFLPRGYDLTGQIYWEVGEDRGVIFVAGGKVEVVGDQVFNAGPSWNPSTFASAKVKELIQNLADSADDTGCSPDLTVVSALHLTALQKACTKGFVSKASEPLPSPAVEVEVDPNDNLYREAADTKWGREGECEIDDGAVVSVSDDDGAYVAAWVWISDEEAGIRREPDIDEDPDEGSDAGVK